MCEEPRFEVEHDPVAEVGPRGGRSAVLRPREFALVRHPEVGVGPDEAETSCRRYDRRWRIENEHESIKGDLLARTSSKDHRARPFCSAFSALLYGMRLLTEFLPRADVDGEVEHVPVLTAGECRGRRLGVSSPTDPDPR
jgi:hypothetical protein